MTHTRIAPRQRVAAKLVGSLYVIQMAMAVFADSYVRGALIVRDDAVQTAKNIAAHEVLFRVSIVTDLLIYAGVIALVWGLYVILQPISRTLALLAVFWRLVENAVLATTTLTAFVALKLLGGADYVQPIGTEQAQSLARVFLAVYGSGLSVGFVFLGFGSALFSYVWFKSGYIPRLLAGWGIFASLVLSVVTLFTMIYPGLWDVLGITYMLPMGLYEVGLGVWLIVRGLREPEINGANQRA